MSSTIRENRLFPPTSVAGSVVLLTTTTRMQHAAAAATAARTGIVCAVVFGDVLCQSRAGLVRVRTCFTRFRRVLRGTCVPSFRCHQPSSVNLLRWDLSRVTRHAYPAEKRRIPGRPWRVPGRPLKTPNAPGYVFTKEIDCYNTTVRGPVFEGKMPFFLLSFSRSNRVCRSRHKPDEIISRKPPLRASSSDCCFYVISPLIFRGWMGVTRILLKFIKRITTTHTHTVQASGDCRRLKINAVTTDSRKILGN